MPAESGGEEDAMAAAAEDVSFEEMLTEFEQQHTEPAQGESLSGSVIDVTATGVFVDVGLKREGIIPLEEVTQEDGECKLKAKDSVTVAVVGTSPDGYYRLSTLKAKRPRDWSALEKAYAEGSVVGGVVKEVIKGGLAVDIGGRAFMPASRSGTRDVAAMEALVGQEIRCKVIQLDTAKEDIVVDRRAVLEEEARAAREKRLSELEVGAVVKGTVRSLTDFGAFVDIGGLDGLLHVTDMAWHRVKKPSDILKAGDEIEVQILKLDRGTRRISLGRKQLIPDPWSLVDEKYKVGQRIRGPVVRLMDFGAFVELESGVDGMIHVSEMSWSKKVRKPADMLQLGEEVEVVILSVSGEQRRIALGLKQALGDPWEGIEQKFPAGTVVDGKVTNLAKFGAFVELTESIEGMIHIADITNEKRLSHPNEVLSEGQQVKAKVLEIDRGKKRIRLGMKQLEPTSADEYIAEHKVGDEVTGRVIDASKRTVRVELADGVTASCKPQKAQKNSAEKKEDSNRPDLSAMTAMLAAKWKEGAVPAETKGTGGFRSGQVGSFRITGLDAENKRIEVEPVE
jgi:small subunit ribosomal protein S1